MKEIEFFVDGLPAPQGSKRHVGRGVMIEASKKVGPWRAAVERAVALLAFEPFDGPVGVEVIFYLPKPKTVKRDLPTVPPDLDKLLRGVFDALTIASVWTDDAIVIETSTYKFYEVGRPGAYVRIYELELTKIQKLILWARDLLAKF